MSKRRRFNLSSTIHTRWSWRLYRDGWIASSHSGFPLLSVRMTKSELPYLKKCLQEMRKSIPVLASYMEMSGYARSHIQKLLQFLEFSLYTTGGGGSSGYASIININKVLPKSHIHIWPEKVSGILDMIFLIIQELGFKGLGFRQSWIWVFIAKSGESFAISYFVFVEHFTFGASTLLFFHFAR